VPNPGAPAALPADGTALASTAGGGNWKTYPPGKMPIGRLICGSGSRRRGRSRPHWRTNVPERAVRGQFCRCH